MPTTPEQRENITAWHKRLALERGASFARFNELQSMGYDGAKARGCLDEYKCVILGGG